MLNLTKNIDLQNSPLRWEKGRKEGLHQVAWRVNGRKQKAAKCFAWVNWGAVERVLAEEAVEVTLAIEGGEVANALAGTDELNRQIQLIFDCEGDSPAGTAIELGHN